MLFNYINELNNFNVKFKRFLKTNYNIDLISEFKNRIKS